MNFDFQEPNLRNARESVELRMREVLWLAMTKVEAIAKSKAPVDTGNLKARIHLHPDQPGKSNYTITDGVAYGIHVEYGTKPHHVPLSPLKEWAGRVLGDEKAAFAVRNAISKRGTPAQPFFRPALHEVEYKWLPIIKSRVFQNG